jgi:hypothetical protein
MTLRRFSTAAFVCVLLNTTWLQAGERYETDNFIVDAPTKQLAKTFGEYAERFRIEKSQEWLGETMPTWSSKCPLKVIIDQSQTGGATTFTFNRGRSGGVRSREMKIFGDVNQLLRSVLPHEITHTVFAHHFGQAVPRWADEGGSVLSENDDERYRHDVRCREILNQGGKAIKLRTLFALNDYPPEMFVLYAQGYSVTQFLIDRGGRQKFLQFVGEGLQNGNRNWEAATRIYGFNSVEELEEAWLLKLKNTVPSRTSVASNNRPSPSKGTAGTTALASRGTETRTSAVPGLPQLEAPVVSVARGAAPDRERAANTEVSQLPIPPLPRLLPPEPPARR